MYLSIDVERSHHSDDEELYIPFLLNIQLGQEVYSIVPSITS